jgi:hypothetical protein
MSRNKMQINKTFFGELVKPTLLELTHPSREQRSRTH